MRYYLVHSFVVHYNLEEQSNNFGRITFKAEKQGHKYLTVVSTEKR